KDNLLVLGFRYREVHPPTVRWPLPMKQVRPFGRVGNVVTFRVTVLPEVVGDLNIQGEVRIREPLELDVEVLAHDAAGALSADDEGASDRFGFARRVDDVGDDARAVLLEPREGGGEAQVNVGVRLCELQGLLDDLDALALEHIGKAGIVLEM